MNVPKLNQPNSKRPAGNQSSRVRRSESRYLLPILVPPLLVCLLFAYGKYQDAAIANDVQNELNRLGESDVMQTLRMTTASFDNRLDDTQSKAWLDVLQATEWMFSIAEEIDAPAISIFPGTDGKPGEARRRWEKGAAPILANVHKLVDEAGLDSDPVWHPLVFAEETLLPALQNSSMITRLLEAEFQVAVADGDASKALKSLQSINGVIRAFDWQIGIGSEINHQSLRRSLRELINDSLAMGLWKTDKQLIQLRALLSDRHSAEDRWRATWEQHYAYTLAKWENEGQHISAFHHQYLTMPAAKKAILESMRTISQSSVTNESGVTCPVGTVGFAEVIHHREYADLQHPSHIMTPSIVAIPFANQRSDFIGLVDVTDLASSLALDQIQRRLTLTAIALKQFKMKEGHWPKNVQELESVGHKSADSIVEGSSRFEIREVGDDAVVAATKLSSDFAFLLRKRPVTTANIHVR